VGLKQIWVTAEIKVETDDALMINAGFDKDTWIPKSQILDYSDDYKLGDTIEIEIPEWLALDKGLI